MKCPTCALPVPARSDFLRTGDAVVCTFCLELLEVVADGVRVLVTQDAMFLAMLERGRALVVARRGVRA